MPSMITLKRTLEAEMPQLSGRASVLHAGAPRSNLQHLQVGVRITPAWNLGKMLLVSLESDYSKIAGLMVWLSIRQHPMRLNISHSFQK